MIRINLLTVERERTKPKKAQFSVSEGQKVTVGATLVLLLTVLGIGWWAWSLHQQSIALDQDIARAEVETRNLRSVLAQDQSSRSVPDRLWLDNMTQAGSDFTLNGYATSMTALSDFVGGIEATTWFR